MGQIDALKLVDNLRARLVDLALSENFVRDAALQEACRAFWSGLPSEGGLISELWIEGAFSAELSGDTLASLVKEGLFSAELCRHLDREDRFPATRTLFTHQSRAIRESVQAPPDDRPALVITAGTGTGKTEAFLLPILHELWANPRQVGETGMRCLILYPMNALVADQVERVYSWLMGQDRLSVFHFTGETPENTYEANRMNEPLWESCRRRTRQEARASTPDIVITNYSMLEYMLCRPQDAGFFGPALRAIVVDEAHLYNGALAAEITLLLRRVRDRCRVDSCNILHLATSATLGGGDDDLRRFAATLFSRDESRTEVLRGKRNPLQFYGAEAPPAKEPLPAQLAPYASTEVTTLDSSDQFVPACAETIEQLRPAILSMVGKTAIEEADQRSQQLAAPFLYYTLSRAPLARRLAKTLFEDSILPLRELSSRLWGTTGSQEDKATLFLLRLTAAARREPKSAPILPHRLHLLVRAPEGLAVCLNPACAALPERKLGGRGCVQAPADRCSYCTSVALPLYRCDTCGEVALAGFEDLESGRIQPGHFASPVGRRYYLVITEDDSGLPEVRVDPVTGAYGGAGSPGVRLFRAPCPEHGDHCHDASECARQCCPKCGVGWSPSAGDEEDEAPSQNINPFRGAERVVISVVAETILHGLPPLPDDTKNWKPAGGRRLLCFSDARSQAARLGPLLTSQHEMWIVRSVMARIAKETPGGVSVPYLQEDIQRLKDQLAATGIPAAVKIQKAKELLDKQQQLKAAETGILFTDFATQFAGPPEVAQILERDLGERHQAGDGWSQSRWEDNAQAVRRRAEALIARELDRPPQTEVSVESVGLIEVAYPGIDALRPPADLLGLLPDRAAQSMRDMWPELVAALLYTMRRDQAVEWSQETSFREWMGESPLVGRWLTETRNGWHAKAFSGSERHLRVVFVSNVLRQLQVPEERAAEVLRFVFNQLYQLAGDGSDRLPWLRRDESHQVAPKESQRAIQILLDRLCVRRPERLFRCKDTGTLWPRSVQGWAPMKGCRGNLIPIMHEEADEDPRWGRARRELSESPIFRDGLWAEEHSAQLSARENKRLQMLFKDGIRNILSSTTTMELGIDIGGLNGVLMSNVPPGRANHLQRAGRAGRRSDGSAIVVTYAKARAFDREVFREFGNFLGKPMRRPVVFLERDRFIRRHLHAFLLGEWFSPLSGGKSGAMDAYGKMGGFCGVSEPPRWDSGAEKPVPKPAGACYDIAFRKFLEAARGDTPVRERCSAIAQGTPLACLNQDSEWQAFLDEATSAFLKAIKNWREDVELLLGAWEDVPQQPPPDSLNTEKAKANSIRYQIKALCDLTVIEWLANNRFLPRYGFPINLQKLVVRRPKDESEDRSVREERYRLERPSLLALAEYVPGADVLVGGKIAVSRGIQKHWTDATRDKALGLQYRALTCGGGHTYRGTSEDKICPECGSEPVQVRLLLFPRFGYTTAGWDPPTRGHSVDRVGEVHILVDDFTVGKNVQSATDFAQVPGLTARYSDETELLVRNEGEHGHGFALCTRCGFADSEQKPNRQGAIDLPPHFLSHASIFSTKPTSFCWRKGDAGAPVLRNRVLAAYERTDLLILDWPTDAPVDDVALHSLGMGLVLAGSRLLEVDSRELGMVLKPVGAARSGIVLFDTAAGGSGHCLELFGLGRPWIEEARRLLRGTNDHDERCRWACLDCILDFSGQFKARKFDRCAGLRLLEQALSR